MMPVLLSLIAHLVSTPKPVYPTLLSTFVELLISVLMSIMFPCCPAKSQ